MENIEVSAMDPANMKELILLSIDGLHVKIATFLGSGADSLLVVSMQQCQLDDLCPSSPRPIMLAHDPAQQPFLELLCTQVGCLKDYGKCRMSAITDCVDCHFHWQWFPWDSEVDIERREECSQSEHQLCKGCG